MKKYNTVLTAVLAALILLSGCSKESSFGDPSYESMEITIVSQDSSDGAPDNASKKITIKELRKLEQHELYASYQRTTGMTESFKMKGPYLNDVLKSAGIDASEYEGIGVTGSDGYYCLLSREVVQSTPDLMLALNIDGSAKLDDIDMPARLAVQGQLGPYWVRAVDKIILYEEIPEKKITSVWSFKNLSEGIKPYKYEYYGSKDDAVELSQIFTRLDNVDSKAFFTMKSSDGFKKNEAIGMVNAGYYIKIKGEDSPTNISPYIKLGMNVKNIAWFSTNADAAIFPEELNKYLEPKTIGEYTGLPLSEIMYETEVEKLKGESFDILGTKGEKVTVRGEDLDKGILAVTNDNSHSVIWEEGLKYSGIKDMMRIRHNNE